MTFWTYGVVVHGIKKRCRKPDLHVSEELDRDEVPNEEKAKALARQWLEKNMKAFTGAKATVKLWTLKGDGVKTWEPFNKNHNLEFPL